VILRDRSKWILSTVWVVLFLASGPILLDYASHVATHSWAWYVLVFLPITPLAISMTPVRKPRVIGAILLVSLGATLETVAMASASLGLGRIGFILATTAVLLLQGRASVRTTVLLILCVPIPHRILERLGETLLPQLAQILATVSRWSGTPALAMGTQVEKSASVFELDATDIGWTAAAFAFGLTWFACLCFKITIRRSILAAALIATGGALGHALITISIFHLSASSDPSALRLARDLLAFGLASFGVGIASVWLIRLDGTGRLPRSH
jgi:hypothetical protein